MTLGYVGYDAAHQSVVVGHQGTNPKNMYVYLHATSTNNLSLRSNFSEADLVDADFILGELDQSLFPGISTSILVHSGFRDSHARCGLKSIISHEDTT